VEYTGHKKNVQMWVLLVLYKQDFYSHVHMKYITMEDFLEREKTGQLPILLDVREPDEWADGHIDTAIHIPVAQVAGTIETVIPDKNAEIIVYCASGGRSRRVVEELVNMGYPHATNLDGGFFVYQMHTL